MIFTFHRKVICMFCNIDNLLCIKYTCIIIRMFKNATGYCDSITRGIINVRVIIAPGFVRIPNTHLEM